MIILIDNYDSFTYNIYHYLSDIGAEVKVYRNNKITSDELFLMKPTAIVLSPGPKTPNQAGICLDIIKKNKNTPILGICLGHQTIGQGYGSKIIQCKEIMHGKIDNMMHNNHKLFTGVNNNFKATRYHSLIIEKKSLSPKLKIIAETENGIIMGVSHIKKKIYGLQFHPESIGTNQGKKILNNFINLVNNDL